MNDARGWDVESRLQAFGYLVKLNDLQFLFLAFTYHNIFSITDILYNVLQKKAVDVNYWSSQIQSTIVRIGELHEEEQFKEVFNSLATALANCPAQRPTRKGFSEDSVAQLSLRFTDIRALHFLELSDSTRFPALYGSYFDFDRLKN
ncbi:UNVERIFIED_CONTAM: hypothetical protein FKN15_026832 [Acipenser sinensis]